VLGGPDYEVTHLTSQCIILYWIFGLCFDSKCPCLECHLLNKCFKFIFSVLIAVCRFDTVGDEQKSVKPAPEITVLFLCMMFCSLELTMMKQWASVVNSRGGSDINVS